ncbi:MAG TPA: hypothetical protein VM432_04215 [Bdellovibrionales bacterium]|nr:hypothetical protein [Bdellovibrionales bacterium]
MKNTKVSADGAASVDLLDEKKMPLRDRYLLERDRIQHEIGGLNRILETLGLSQRKVCQLLLVDPSAWTRWNKTEAPPHIYQALRWLIQLKKLNPDITGPSDFARRLDVIKSSTQAQLREIEGNVAQIERALTIAPVSTTQFTVADDTLERALEAQEKRFRKTIEALQAKIDRMSAPVAKKAKAPAKKKKTKPKAAPKKRRKKMKAKPKTQSRRPQKSKARKIKVSIKRRGKRFRSGN